MIIFILSILRLIDAAVFCPVHLAGNWLMLDLECLQNKFNYDGKNIQSAR